MKRYSHVIWDWNGTLFNDVDWCLHVINSMMEKRSIKQFDGLEGYHGAFGFPVIDYYRKLGFDFEKEPFALLAEEYMSLYGSGDRVNCSLHKNAEYVLKKISDMGIRQVMLSASKLSNLLSQINYFDMKKYFDEILGISDIYAAGKIEIGLDYISRANIENAVLIGDTAHDYEVAQKLDVDCILIAKGHQGKGRLLSCGVPVLDDITDVLEYVILTNT